MANCIKGLKLTPSQLQARGRKENQYIHNILQYSVEGSVHLQGEHTAVLFWI